jgi:hypothetical protein
MRLRRKTMLALDRARFAATNGQMTKRYRGAHAKGAQGMRE